MKIVKYTCDAFQRDLTEGTDMPSFRLELAPQDVPHSGDISSRAGIRPEIERYYHFCGLGCLKNWINRRAV